jgi:hypothetical protein
VTQGKKTFTLGVETAELLEELAERFYADNQTEAVRVAVQALATQHGLGETAWVIDGYVTTRSKNNGTCHRCKQKFQAKEVIYQPVFRRGFGPEAFSELPEEEIYICQRCLEKAPEHRLSSN